MGTVALRLFFAILCAGLVVLPFFLLYGREVRNVAESDQLLRFMPPQQAVNTGYISFRIKLLSIDLTQGRSDMMIYNIRPFGRFAAAPGSMFLSRDTILFVNGNQIRLPADIPPGEQRITVQHAGGNVNHYPFDKHTLRLGFYAMTADELQASVRAAASGTNLGRSPFVPLGWTIASRSALSMSIENEGTPQLADLGVNDVTLAIRRHGAHRWFAMTIVGLMWAMSLVALANTVVVVFYRLDVNPTLFAVNALLLAALPIIRNSMPRVPAYGTLTDTLGLYWNITLVSLSMIMLSLFSFLKHRTEDRHRRARQARAAAIEAHNMQRKLRAEQKNQDPTAAQAAPQLPMIPHRV
ncbi:hypothetical protein BCR44DRAFT_25200 [Catenaria anguillulae PL171]|uniref:DUF4436 domain-containing protein n=1 Tax=Catenaria anguillulae PL171 TaxID=765915 RepID=A0A1Y2HHI1_9FUNG|nr:hypothetical protein BCR44DRAFT_25200 [Catenaria anguillulae PL171]